MAPPPNCLERALAPTIRTVTLVVSPWQCSSVTCLRGGMALVMVLPSQFQGKRHCRESAVEVASLWRRKGRGFPWRYCRKGLRRFHVNYVGIVNDVHC